MPEDFQVPAPTTNDFALSSAKIADAQLDVDPATREPLTADITLAGATLATDDVLAQAETDGGVVAVTAYDSANWRNIPRNAAAVLPYADGRYAYTHKAFPHARYRSISVLGSWSRASIFDIEPGCIWPPSRARSAVQARQHRYGDATVYCFRSAVPAVKAALHGLTYKAILSTLDGSIYHHYEGWILTGCQFWGGVSAPYDKTVIFDRRFLHTP